MRLPENAFDESLDPYYPELAPAFARPPVLWEEQFPHGCVLTLLHAVRARLVEYYGERATSQIGGGGGGRAAPLSLPSPTSDEDPGKPDERVTAELFDEREAERLTDLRIFMERELV